MSVVSPSDCRYGETSGAASSVGDVRSLVKEAHANGAVKVDWLMGIWPLFSNPEDNSDCGKDNVLFKLAYPRKSARLSAAYLPLLDDPNENIRASAAIALGVMGEKTAALKIRSLFRGLPRSGEDADSDDKSREVINREIWIGGLYAHSLMELGDCQMVPEIIAREVLAPHWALLFGGTCKDAAYTPLHEKVKAAGSLRVPDPFTLKSTVEQTIARLYGEYPSTKR